MTNSEKAGNIRVIADELKVSPYVMQSVKATLEHPEYNPFAKQSEQTFYSEGHDSSGESSLNADHLSRSTK